MSKDVSIRQRAVKSETRTAAGDVLSEIVVLVLRTHGALTRAGDEMAKPAGQSSARWQILAAVEEEPCSVADIARALGLARQSVQRVADAIEADGLARFVDNPNHQRAKLLKLSPEGRRALTKIAAAQRTWADEIGARVGRAELERTRTGLARVLDALHGEQAAPGDQDA